MAQQTIIEKKESQRQIQEKAKEGRITTLFEEAEVQLDLLIKKKRDIIRDLAAQIKEIGGQTKSKIAALITKRLERYVNRAYVYEVLDVEFKSEQRSTAQEESARKRQPNKNSSVLRPQDYDIDNVRKYRQETLVSIVLWLDKEYKALKQENEELKTKLKKR